MMNRRRLFAGLLCAVMVLSLFVSSAYIVLESGHDCSGIACEVCQTILQAKALLQRFALAVMILISLLLAQRMAQMAPAAQRRRSWDDCTLVSWKVRLNN